MSDDTRILDCGHVPSPHSDITTGTAHTPDDKEVCWECAYALELGDLKTAEKWTGYLTGTPDKASITNWPGKLLVRVTRVWKVRNNMAGYIWRWRGVDVHGAKWYGTSPGFQTYARMHRSAIKAWHPKAVST